MIVTHNMQQAARVSDFTAFMYLGELVEFNTTSKMFTTPRTGGPRNTCCGCRGVASIFHFWSG